MAVFKGAVVHCRLLLLALLGFSGAAADICTSGELCCAECESECYERTQECYIYCWNPCFLDDECKALGEDHAREAAALACDEAKDACEVPRLVASPVAEALPSKPIDRRACCKAVLGSCSRLAIRSGCSTSSFGACTADEFEKHFRDSISFVCKNASCRDFLCKDELVGDPRCS